MGTTLITKTWLANNFNKFNKEYFGNKLPIPMLIVSNTRKRFGCCGFKGGMYSRMSKKWLRTPNYYIQVSAFTKRTEKEYLTTLLHEMIHLHFYVMGEVNEGHGRNFQNFARSLDRFGWDIHTCSKPNIELNKDEKMDRCNIIVFTEKGKIWVCRINALHLMKMYNFAKNQKTWSNVNLYTTTSKLFSGYRECRTRFSGHTFTPKAFESDILPYLEVK